VGAVPRAKITNPRVFHLVQNNEDAGENKGISNSPIPRHESPIIIAMSSVHENIVLPYGDISIMPSRSAINALAQAAYASDIGTLLANIRLCCQYSVAANGEIIHLNMDGWEQIKHHLVEETLSMLPMIYPTKNDYPRAGDLPALRKNGMLAIIHPLQVCSGLAAIAAPLREDDRLSFAPVVLAALHDSIEDTEDSSNAMKNVKFRVAGKNGDEIEIIGKDGMLAHLIGLYSKYNVEVANRIAKDLVLLTREKVPEGMTKEDYYTHTYLHKLYRRVFCAKVKAEDFHSNSMAISDVEKEEDMLHLAERLISKGLPQVLAWKKDAWVEYHRLLARLEDLLSLVNDKKYLGIVDEIMAPSAADLENFKRGYVLTGSRKFTYTLMATMPISGSPVLTHYRTIRDGKLISEVDIPLCKNLDAGRVIIRHGFPDVRAEDITQAQNLIKKRLGSPRVLSFPAKESWDISKRMKLCKKEYDGMHNSGALGPALAGFNRPNFTKEAEKKWGPWINTGSKRLERFKFYKVQVR